LWGTWTLTLIVLALIAIAVAHELAIAHPGDDATVGLTILAFGGPALFLLSQLLFHRAATAPLTMIVGIAASSAVLVAVAIADTIGERDQAPSTLG
jgi:low temperature requirement protein LtrA